jgi:hypothetical protein
MKNPLNCAVEYPLSFNISASSAQVKKYGDDPTSEPRSLIVLGWFVKLGIVRPYGI